MSEIRKPRKMRLPNGTIVFITTNSWGFHAYDVAIIEDNTKRRLRRQWCILVKLESTGEVWPVPTKYVVRAR